MLGGLYPPAGGPLTPLAMMQTWMRVIVSLFMIDALNSEFATVESVCKQTVAYYQPKPRPLAVQP